MNPRPEVLEAFKVLVRYGIIGEALCGMVGEGALRMPMAIRAICSGLGLPRTREANVEAILEDGQSFGLFERVSETTWRGKSEALASEVRSLLAGAILYLTHVHRDATIVDVVLTKPPAPSAMAQALDDTLEGSWGLEDTQALLPAIAERAHDSFVVMTPFLDEAGAKVVVNLFEVTKAADRVLIVRDGPGGVPQEGLVLVQAKLAALGVKVLNFRLERLDGTGYETFHAKVVLADRSAAYLGSANMTKWSLRYSLELGIFIQGLAAERIADVIQAIRSVSAIAKTR